MTIQRISCTILLLLPLYLAGCKATLTSDAAKVQLHRQFSTVLDGCKRLAPLTARATKRPFVDPLSALEADLRDQTARMGGDSLVLMQIDETSTGYVRHGIAYKCF